MMFNIVRLSIFLLLVNILCGLYVTSDDNRRAYHLLKQRSAENDNEYVWFTRNIPDDINNEEIKQERDLFRSKMFHRKNPFFQKYNV